MITDQQPDRNSSPEPSTDIQDACAVHMVLLVSRNGNALRKPYMSLHSAQAALQRAEERGQPARLVLCKLVPLLADLEFGPERAL